MVFVLCVFCMYTGEALSSFISLKVVGGFASYPPAVFDSCCHFWSTLSISQAAVVLFCVLTHCIY